MNTVLQNYQRKQILHTILYTTHTESKRQTKRKTKRMKLGDLIERITYYTGIKWVVKKIWGDRCGCDERQEQLNDIELW